VSERVFRRRQITQILVAAAEDDAGRDVVGMQFQAGREQLQSPGDVSDFSVHLCERRKGQPMRIFGVSALKFFDFARGHRFRYSRSEIG
jgi:hypothetical protein